MNSKRTFRLVFSFFVAFYILQARPVTALPTENVNPTIAFSPIQVVVNEDHLPDTNSLRKALTGYMEKVDDRKYYEVIPFYDTNFLSIRVVDAGQFIKMNYNQMVYFWNMQSKGKTAGTFNHKAIVTEKTTIHYLEAIGNTGYVILTRVKDLGNGPEPMFYTLVWTYKNNQWYLLREFVHQRTMPKFH